MNPHAHRRLTAWLGLIAIWLIVLAPVVSRLVVAARYREPVATLCTAAASSASPHAPGSGMIACGYCDLLATHATLPNVTPPLPILVMFVTMIIALPILSSRFTPFGAFPAGKPRAPPVLSRA